MRAKSLLILASVVLAIGGYLFFIERDVASTDERRDTAKRVLDIDPASVHGLRIDRAGVIIQMIRQPARETSDGEAVGQNVGSTWRLVEPFEAAADRAQIEGLLRELAGLERQRTIEGLDRQAAGLEPPRATITITSEMDTSEVGNAMLDTVLEIGPEVPATDSMLVARTGHDTVERVAKTLWDALAKPPGDWRDRTVLAIAREDVLGVRLRGLHGEVAIGRRGEELWIEVPFEDRADPSLAGRLLGAVALITAERYVDDPQEATAADGSAGRIEVRVRDQPEATVISIGQTTEEESAVVHAQVSAHVSGPVRGQVFTMRSALVELLALEPPAWRDPRWATLQVFAIQKAILTDQEGTVEIARQDAEWQRDGEPVDYATASELLYAITDLESTAVFSSTDPSLPGVAGHAPMLTIRLESEAGSDAPSHENLSLFALPDGRLVARSNRRDAVLLFAADVIQTLRERLAALRAAPLVTEEAETPEDTVSS